jgi:hypothetical protein
VWLKILCNNILKKHYLTSNQVGSYLIFTISSFIKLCGNRLKFVWVASGIIGGTPTTFVNVYFGIILVYFHLKIETSFKYFLWNHRSGTFHRELKWKNKLIFNIWLHISSSLTIVSMIFEIHLHLLLYFINIIFSQI